ncbi:MAG: DUF177 domain-containing protein [Atopobiaceae bacterium]|nr:DUF177 domain-containing protein [Atopobiaceae bacterium]
MESVVFHLDERLANAGDSLPLTGHIDQDSYSLGEREFALPEGIEYDLVLTNAGEGILATGVMRARVDGTCDRCLDPASFDVSAEVGQYFLFEEPEDAGDDDDDELEYGLVSPENDIDLGEAIMAALIMETPFVVLCREDCKGLCPTCGANLNEGDCGCAAHAEEERRSASPFAALANLKLDD